MRRGRLSRRTGAKHGARALALPPPGRSLVSLRRALGAYGLGLNDSEEPIRDYEQERPLSHRFRLLRPQVQTFLGVPRDFRF